MIFFAENDDDWQVRMDAAENINDEYVLKEIFSRDNVDNVCISAMNQIKDTDFLIDECLNNPNSHLRLAILNRIIVESLLSEKELSMLLEKILLNDFDVFVLKRAFDKVELVSQDVLIRIANSKDNETVKKEAIKNITDEKTLSDFALNDSNDYIRLEAIQNPNLINPESIFEIILNESNDFNRLMAFAKINDCETLAEIVYEKELYPYMSEISQYIYFPTNDYFLEDFRKSDDVYVRCIDILFVEDAQILEDIVLHESNADIRASAIRNRNFKNQEILEALIKKETDSIILLETVSKLANQELLMEYIKDNLEYSNVIVEAISNVNDLELLEELSTYDDYRIRLEAVKRISNLKNADGLLRKIALTETNEEICIEAINAMSQRNDLIEIADFRDEKNIRIAALKNIKSSRLLYSFLNAIPKDSPFENALINMVLKDSEVEIRCIATSKLNDKEMLDNIAADDDENSLEAQKRLNSLFEDIKSIDSVKILDVLSKSGDGDISKVARDTLNDLETWQDRIFKISNINDIDILKDISQNDFNYVVRNEAEGKLEKLLFNMRLDEIERPENQEKLKKIAIDETYPENIRNKALYLIQNKKFNI